MSTQKDQKKLDALVKELATDVKSEKDLSTPSDPPLNQNE